MKPLPICDRLVLTPDCDVAALRDNGVEAAELIAELVEALEGDIVWLDALSLETIERDTVNARIRGHRVLLAKARGEA